SGVAASPADAAPTPRGRLTQIAPGSRVQGEVTGATELLIEGEVEGTIKVEAKVEVGATGVVKGPITAQVVRVSGKVMGNVRGADRVEIGPSAVLEGDIAAPRVVIAEGAFFKGKVEMRSDKAKAGRPPQAAEPKGES